MSSKNPNKTLGNDFWFKTLPVLTTGMIIWVITTIIFGGFLGIIELQLNMFLLIVYLVLYVFLWALTIILSFMKKNLFAMISFFCASLITGLLSSTLLIWARTVVVFEIVLGLFFIAFFIGIGVTIGLLILGLILRKNISNKWIYPLLLFGFILVTLELSLIFIFGYNPFLLITSIFVLIWLFGVILWDGSRLPETVDDGYWMLAVIDIFLDMVNVIIRIFVILIEILADTFE